MLTDSPKNWTEDFHLENGNYMNYCCLCGDSFLGYKRRVVCKLCSDEGSKISDAGELEEMIAVSAIINNFD